MKNQYSNGEAIDIVTPSGGLSSGAGCLIGSLFGIAALTAAAGAANVLCTRGAYTLNKNSAEAWTVGALIYWDATSKQCTTTSTGGNKLIGVAVAAAANPSLVGVVRLNGIFIS